MFGHDEKDPAAIDNKSDATTPTDNNAAASDSGASDTPAPAPSADLPSLPTNDSPSDSTPAGPAPTTGDDTSAPKPDDLLEHNSSDDLLNIKQQALQQLSPLVDHLDQTPEEKFRTTMMMIQAADNDSLIQRAYDAAQAIPDEKVRAQALLDIINEINYFTQQNSN